MYFIEYNFTQIGLQAKNLMYWMEKQHLFERYFSLITWSVYHHFEIDIIRYHGRSISKTSPSLLNLLPAKRAIGASFCSLMR